MLRTSTLFAFLSLACGLTTFSQGVRNIDPELSRHRVWIETSHGPSITKNDLFILGPSLSFASLTKNDRFIKVKLAYHHGFDVLVNFPQTAFEANLMTAVIQRSAGGSFEFHYGLGVITGRRYGKDISGQSHGFFISFSSTYEEVPFVTFGIPMEFRYQFAKIIGLGLDANLNLETPYIGLKVFTRFGVAKK